MAMEEEEIAEAAEEEEWRASAKQICYQVSPNLREYFDNSLTLKRDKLKTVLLAKDKELVNNTMQVVKNNKKLREIINKLNDFNVDSLDESTKRLHTKLQKSIGNELETDKSWEELEKHIKNVHFDFLKRLK